MTLSFDLSLTIQSTELLVLGGLVLSLLGLYVRRRSVGPRVIVTADPP